MSLERNYNRSGSIRRGELKQSFASTLNQLFQQPEQKTHYSSMPGTSESPRKQHDPIPNTSGASPSESVANSTSLSVDSPMYPSLGSSSSFLSASPSFYSTASPTGLSPSSPTGFCTSGLSYLPCNDSSCLLHARSSLSNLQCFSTGTQSNFSSDSPVNSLSSNSSVNNQPTDSQYLDLAVALRNIGVDTDQNRISPNNNNSPRHESTRLPSSYESLFDDQMLLQSTENTSHDSLIWHVNNSFGKEPMNSHCLENIHSDDQQRYCLTCSQPFCDGCNSNRHSTHTSMNFLKFLSRSETQARETMGQLHMGLNTIQNALENVQMDAEMLEQKAKQAAADVMLYMRRLVSAVEAREKDILNIIEKTRVAKFAALKAKDESLRNDKVRLMRATDRLSTAMKSCSSTCNPKNLLASKDMALAEIFQIEQNRRHRSTREENWISFTAPGNNLWHAITTLGNIQTTNPGPIGEGRAIYGTNSSQSYRIPFSARTSSKPIMRTRPITNNNYPVAVRDNQSYKMIQIVGNSGDVADNICRPWGVTCDRRGHIIVADRSNNRIQIYREDGTLIRRFGSPGTGPGEFDRPAGIAVDSWQRIIVADKDNHRIQILLMDGTFVHYFGKKGYEPGDFNYPWDVAVNSECQIAVSDTRNHRVQLFSPDGTFLRMYGYDSQPNMLKQFDSPRGVCFNPEGELVITDFNNHHLVIIDEWFTDARIINCEAVDGGNRAFLRPQGLVVDNNGNIIVADSRNHRIQVFDSDGRFLWKYGSQGVGPNEMDRPAGVALLPDGKIAIVDFGNNRVLLLKKEQKKQ